MDVFNGMVEEEYTRRWNLVRVRAFIELGYIQTMHEKHEQALESFRTAMAHFERLPKEAQKTNVRLEIVIGTVYSYRLQGNVVTALKEAKSFEEAREQPR